MNPAIVIPTYWANDPSSVGEYDHATPVDAESPELARCLDSLEQVEGVIRTILLLVASPESERAARVRVDEIAAAHPGLNPVVIGSPEARVIAGRIEEIAPGMDGENVSLRGYGAIRNMGLAACALLGHDVAVFMDDDELVLDANFLADAVYGLGQVTRQNLPVLAKTGHFLDKKDSPLADEASAKWYERWWTKRSEFNAWMRGALEGTRICRSNYVCGGCMVVHAEAYTRVAFDPYITRGEDLDYLFNLRLFGLDLWFDGEWKVKHLPPDTPDESNRFLQDVYRWLYERAKLSRAAERQDLHRVTAASLMPYPGKWVSDEVEQRIFRTALARAIGCRDHVKNFRIWHAGRAEAASYAKRNRDQYLRFQSYWPSIANGLWNDERLAAEMLAAHARGESEANPEAVPEVGEDTPTAQARAIAAEADAIVNELVSETRGEDPAEAADATEADAEVIDDLEEPEGMESDDASENDPSDGPDPDPAQPDSADDAPEEANR